MNGLKPKEQHERMLANVDRDMIVQYLKSGQEQDVARIAVKLARQCDLFVHFQRLWMLRVADLDEKLGTERYMQHIYVNKRALYKEMSRKSPL